MIGKSKLSCRLEAKGLNIPKVLHFCSCTERVFALEKVDKCGPVSNHIIFFPIFYELKNSNNFFRTYILYSWKLFETY